VIGKRTCLILAEDERNEDVVGALQVIDGHPLPKLWFKITTGIHTHHASHIA
jgi:hypothetical protein